MSSQSLVEIAYSKLRNMIISGELMPGILLSENEIAKKLEVSRTPIRTAFSRLESEGFVILLKNRGIRIKEISYGELIDMMDIICSFMSFVIDFHLPQGNLINIEQLKVCLKNQLEATQKNDYLGYVTHSLLFQRTIIEAAKNPTMLQVMDNFRDKQTHIAVISWKLTPFERHYSANGNNERILKAILTGNCEEMKKVLFEGYKKSRKNVIMRGRI